MRRWEILAIAAMIALGTAGHYVREAIHIKPPAAADLQPPDPLLLGVFALGDKRLGADMAWLKAIYYFSDPAAARHKYAQLSGILNAVLSLDPDFHYAYLFGGLALLSTLDGVQGSDAMLLRGMTRCPQDWRFSFYLGFNAFAIHEDKSRAGYYFGLAAQNPGAPPYVGPLAAKLLASAGDCKSSLALLRRLQENSQDRYLIKRLREREKHVTWECSFQLLEAAVARYTEKQGTPPTSLEQLARAGLIDPHVLVDPYGGLFGVDASGRVTSTTHIRRLQMHLPQSVREDIRRW